MMGALWLSRSVNYTCQTRWYSPGYQDWSPSWQEGEETERDVDTTGPWPGPSLTCPGSRRWPGRWSARWVRTEVIPTPGLPLTTNCIMGSLQNRNKNQIEVWPTQPLSYLVEEQCYCVQIVWGWSLKAFFPWSPNSIDWILPTPLIFLWLQDWNVGTDWSHLTDLVFAEAVSARPAQWAPPASPGVEVRALSSRPASQAVTQETGQSRPRPQSAESQVQERQNVYLG